jgi:hypothetical protein
MPFDDDNRDPDPIVFVRPAMTIKINTTNDGPAIPPIELPAVSMRRSEVSPAWLALHDAEQNEPKERDQCR